MNFSKIRILALVLGINLVGCSYESYNFIEIRNNSNDEICITDYTGNLVKKVPPLSVENAKFIVKNEGHFYIKKCSERLGNARPLMETYHNHLLPMCHKFKIMGDSSVEYTSAMIVSDIHQDYEGACSDAQLSFAD